MHILFQVSSTFDQVSSTFDQVQVHFFQVLEKWCQVPSNLGPSTSTSTSTRVFQKSSIKYNQVPAKCVLASTSTKYSST